MLAGICNRGGTQTQVAERINNPAIACSWILTSRFHDQPLNGLVGGRPLLGTIELLGDELSVSGQASEEDPDRTSELYRKQHD